jgi:hypothetical protein
MMHTTRKRGGKNYAMLYKVNMERQTERKCRVSDSELAARLKQLSERLVEIGCRGLLQVWRALEVEMFPTDGKGWTPDLTVSTVIQKEKKKKGERRGLA